MANDIVKIQPLDVDKLMTLGRVCAQSGFFSDARQEAQAVVKIMAGRELGFPEIASMTGIHVINGRVTFSAQLMAAAVKKSGRYNYRVLMMDDAACEIEFFEEKESIGKSKFTVQDARKAGTKNMDKFPRNMLFARAMSNGVRWHCPDVMGGAPVYTPEEMGADVDGEGNVIDVPHVEVVQEQPAQITAAPTEPLATPSMVDRVESLAAAHYRSEWSEEFKKGLIYKTTKKRTADITLLTQAEAQRMIAYFTSATETKPQPA